MEELFDVYDRAGNWRGLYPRSECHGNPDLIHQSVHVVVFDSSMKKILLQKRSLEKDIQPGKWDSAVGGHVAAGESAEAAARRELTEELGVDIPVEFFFESTIRNEIESENVTVYRLVCDGPFKFDPLEIDEIRFFDMCELFSAENNFRCDFTPNLQLELMEIKERIYNER